MTNTIKLLGTYGSKCASKNTTCIQINKHSVVDAGNIINGLKDDAKYIDNIFLTHTHLDHIIDICFFIDVFFEQRKKPLKIYTFKQNIDILKKNMFNWDIWPDFSKIYLSDGKTKALEFIPIQMGQIIKIDNNTTIEPTHNNHTSSSCGYIITKKNSSILFTSDTYKCHKIWERINNDKKIKSLLIEVSFPNRLNDLAKESKHLTPQLLKEELKNLQRDDVHIFLNHLKPIFIKDIQQDIIALDTSINNKQIVNDGDILDVTKGLIIN